MKKLNLSFTFSFILSALLLLSCCGYPAAAEAADAATNPAYAKYDFGERKRVVTFASQPLGIFAAVIPEIIRRDQIFRNHLKSRNMELRILPFYSGPDINHFMRQGKIDIAIAGDFPTLNMASTSDIQIVAISKRDKAAVVSRGKYSTLRDLKGKRIAFPAGSSSHLGLLVVLEAAGLKESDVRMLPMDIELLTTALVDGKTDAFAGWEPIPSAALTANKDFRIISQFLNTDYLYWTEGFAKREPELSLHFLTAYIRAIHWLNQSDANVTRAAKWSLSGTEAFLGKQSRFTLAQFKHRIRENLKLIGSAEIPPDEFAQSSYLNRAFELLKSKELLTRQAQWNKVRESVYPFLVKEIHSNQNKYKYLKFDYKVD
jgi:ABC-type nitrate/sulfonate/bicarbonate transport system substrate-binding protein